MLMFDVRQKKRLIQLGLIEDYTNARIGIGLTLPFWLIGD